MMTQLRYEAVFKVKACNDAHISLSAITATPGVHDVYEVVLGAGSNTWSTIRSVRLDQDKVNFSTHLVIGPIIKYTCPLKI